VILREEHRLRVFQNRVLRRIFGPKRDEVKEEWINLHNERFHNLYSSRTIIRMMRWAGHVALVRREGGEGEEQEVIGGKVRGKATARKTMTQVGG
jgi:hypothetical protein